MNHHLGPRVQCAVDLMRQGLSNKQIGSRMGLTAGTVKCYLASAGCHSRFEWMASRIAELEQQAGTSATTPEVAHFAPRAQLAVSLMLKGLPNKEIAYRMGIAVSSVKQTLVRQGRSRREWMTERIAELEQQICDMTGTPAGAD